MGCCGNSHLTKYIIDGKVIAKKYRKISLQKLRGDLICSYPKAKYIEIIEIDGIQYNEVVKNES